MLYCDDMKCKKDTGRKSHTSTMGKHWIKTFFKVSDVHEEREKMMILVP